MRKWARIGIVVMAVFLVGIVGWASTSWSDTQPLVTSAAVGPKYVTYRCGAIFGSGTADRTSTPAPAYPLSRRPCRDRSQRQVLAYVDIVVGVGGLVGLVLLRRRHPSTDDVSLPIAPA